MVSPPKVSEPGITCERTPGQAKALTKTKRQNHGEKRDSIGSKASRGKQEARWERKSNP